jgi:hypothetical protein
MSKFFLVFALTCMAGTADAGQSNSYTCNDGSTLTVVNGQTTFDGEVWAVLSVRPLPNSDSFWISLNEANGLATALICQQTVEAAPAVTVTKIDDASSTGTCYEQPSCEGDALEGGVNDTECRSLGGRSWLDDSDASCENF